MRIQNQVGPHPTKWDRTGIVVEVRQFDQYVVRVDGSGRVTLRNRKFLRKYTPFIPRNPVAMAPGPTAAPTSVPLPRPPTVRPSNMAPASGSQPPVVESKPPSDAPDAPPPPTPEEAGDIPESDPPNHTDMPLQVPDTPPSPGAVPTTPAPTHRSVKFLMPHNKPGLKEQPLPTSPSPMRLRSCLKSSDK